MIVFSPTDMARIKSLTDRTYPHLHPDVRVQMNVQLLEARFRWEYEEWCERMELTADFYEGKVPHGLGGPVKTKKPRKR